MRELEFLPDWYPQTHRRRRLIVLQGWLTLIMVAGMGSWIVLQDRNNTLDERILARLRKRQRLRLGLSQPRFVFFHAHGVDTRNRRCDQ